MNPAMVDVGSVHHLRHSRYLVILNTAQTQVIGFFARLALIYSS